MLTGLGRNARAKQIIEAHRPYDTIRIITSCPDDSYIEATYNGSRTFYESVQVILDGGSATFPPKSDTF